MDEKVTLIYSRVMSGDKPFIALCLLELLQRQTADEKQVGHTKHTNGVGFNRTDSPILTEYATRYQHKNLYWDGLTEEQWEDCCSRLEKYCTQLSHYLTAKQVED